MALEIALKSIEEYRSQNLDKVMIVIYGNHVAEILKSKGIETTVLPRNLEKDEIERAHQEAKGRIYSLLSFGRLI